MNAFIIYEQPLNEIIRVCLRLEHLFQQIDVQKLDDSILGTHRTIALIINILHLLDRPDLKAKLAKELSHHFANLNRYSHLPNLDQQKFSEITSQLDKLSKNLIDSSGKIGHRLRELELLNNLRMHLTNPGGCCSFDIPGYHYWLQSANWRDEIFNDWLQEFNEIRLATDLVLDLIRKNATKDQKKAIHGFHQELLDPQLNLRMIQVHIPKEVPTYPEISIGRHLLTVRFLSPAIEKAPVQFAENIQFDLSYCS